MAPILVAKNLTKRYGGIYALRNCNFEVNNGEIIAVIGPNGAGKSTLLNCITGLVRPDEGEVLLNNRSLANLQPHRIAELGIARTFQNINLFSELTVLQNVQIGIASFRKIEFWKALLTGGKGIGRRAESEARAMLQRFGLESLADVPARHLSFGQQRLVEMARALSQQPKLLLLDEPASGLNRGERERLLELLVDISRQGIAVIWIEHDLGSVMKVAHKVVVLEFGEQICYGEPEEVQKDPKFIKAYLGTEKASHFNRTIEPGSQQKEPLLIAQDLHTYRGTVRALNGVSLRIGESELVAIIGPNGAGKSTLLGTLAGQFRPRQGRVQFRDVSITGLPPESVHRLGITLVPERRGLFPTMTVEENLMLGAYTEVPFMRSLGLPPKEVMEQCEKMYTLFPRLKERRKQLAGTLSGGEQQMLAVARGLMAEPVLLMLDEPSLGLAEKLVEQLFEALRRLADQGTAVLLVEQNARAALPIADRVVGLDRGTVRYEGLPNEFGEDEILHLYNARSIEMGI
ncbi:ATP-binding cassette domain-containing protein [Kyrpidia tusciae]|uniref:ABC transporter related protein n=1 Tax=Kyrpidia tusciae (strain DSM 2912 / NBRC 15312 / T2) TaxID=562970 RepID=D5WPT2_KYRT2|nr:ATP-binding cassette domain-containing protein [Kyrpidia tusciae]ADG06341.1 ABC transporter related protein [Kyrpidia tusciae DSM 2912]